MVSVLNNEGGFYNRRTYVNEARNAGASIHVPCVNKSQLRTALYGRDVYLGFSSIKSVEENTIKILLEEREQNGEYKSLENVILRTALPVIQVSILIRAGALNFTGSVKTAMHWEAHYICGRVENKSRQPQLFDAPAKMHVLPKLEYILEEHLYDELELLEMPFSGSFFDLIQQDCQRDILAAHMKFYTGRTITVLGELVTYKTIPTQNGKIMKFGSFLDRTNTFFDTVHFPKSLEISDFKGMGVYQIEGKVTNEYSHYSINVISFFKMPLKPNPKITDYKPRYTMQQVSKK